MEGLHYPSLSWLVKDPSPRSTLPTEMQVECLPPCNKYPLQALIRPLLIFIGQGILEPLSKHVA